MEHERRADTPMALRARLDLARGRGRLQDLWRASPGLLSAGEQRTRSLYPNLQKRVQLMLGERE